MRSHYVSFTAPNQAVLAEEEVSPADLQPGEALIQAEHSIISSGTERADRAEEETTAAGRAFH